MDKNLKLKNMLDYNFHFKPHFHENLFSLKFLIGSFTKMKAQMKAQKKISPGFSH